MSSLEPECQPENDTTLFDEQRMEEFFAKQMGGFEKKKVFRDDFLGRVGNQETGCSPRNRFLTLKMTSRARCSKQARGHLDFS
jgi:hypothetical protein